MIDDPLAEIESKTDEKWIENVPVAIRPQSKIRMYKANLIRY